MAGEPREIRSERAFCNTSLWILNTCGTSSHTDARATSSRASGDVFWDLLRLRPIHSPMFIIQSLPSRSAQNVGQVQLEICRVLMFKGPITRFIFPNFFFILFGPKLNETWSDIVLFFCSVKSRLNPDLVLNWWWFGPFLLLMHTSKLC